MMGVRCTLTLMERSENENEGVCERDELPPNVIFLIILGFKEVNHVLSTKPSHWPGLRTRNFVLSCFVQWVDQDEYVQQWRMDAAEACIKVGKLPYAPAAVGLELELYIPPNKQMYAQVNI